MGTVSGIDDVHLRSSLVEIAHGKIAQRQGDANIQGIYRGIMEENKIRLNVQNKIGFFNGVVKPVQCMKSQGGAGVRFNKLSIQIQDHVKTFAGFIEITQPGIGPTRTIIGINKLRIGLNRGIELCCRQYKIPNFKRDPALCGEFISRTEIRLAWAIAATEKKHARENEGKIVFL